MNLVVDIDIVFSAFLNTKNRKGCDACSANSRETKTLFEKLAGLLFFF